MEVLYFEDYPQWTLHVALVRNLRNIPKIRNALLKGELTAALVNAALVVSVMQVLSAAQKTLHRWSQGKLITKTLHTELVYSLASRTNISESLKRFGISEDTKNVVCAILLPKGEEVDGDFLNLLDGDMVDISQLSNVFDKSHASKEYKLSSFECESVENIEHAILNRIAVRDVKN